jgi:hypothetical protein
MIRCLSLFDISRISSSEYAANQLKNWHCLLQALSLYSKFTVDSYPTKVFRDVNSLGFGKNYVGQHNVWIFDFEIQDAELDIGELLNIVHQIPMITSLEESAKFPINCTDLYGDNQNIVFLLL